MLRDQRVIAGIGRSWVDEVLWLARLSPFKRGDDLSPEEATTLREAILTKLDGAMEHYERVVTLPIPDKMPIPLEIHRHEGKPCPRCGASLEAVHYEDHVMAYCPTDQTGGKVLKDRRLSRLLKKLRSGRCVEVAVKDRRDDRLGVGDLERLGQHVLDRLAWLALEASALVSHPSKFGFAFSGILRIPLELRRRLQNG